MDKVVILDFDGTIVDFKYPDIGDLKPGAKEVIQQLKDMGYIIKIFSCRTSTELNPELYKRVKHKMGMIEFLDKHEIPYDEIITDSNKPIATFYIDDRAIEYNNDWNEVIDKIKKRGN